MLAAVVLATASLILTDRASINLPASAVRIGDVTKNGGPVAGVVIARLPRGRTELSLSRRAIAALIRRAIPGVAVADGGRNDMVILRAPSIERHANTKSVRLPDAPDVRTGDRLTLISRAGPVTVERQVIALQPGRSGRRLFVRDTAGQVSSIPFVGERAR